MKTEKNSIKSSQEVDLAQGRIFASENLKAPPIFLECSSIEHLEALFKYTPYVLLVVKFKAS